MLISEFILTSWGGTINRNWKISNFMTKLAWLLILILLTMTDAYSDKYTRNMQVFNGKILCPNFHDCVKVTLVMNELYKGAYCFMKSDDGLMDYVMAEVARTEDCVHDANFLLMRTVHGYENVKYRYLWNLLDIATQAKNDIRLYKEFKELVEMLRNDYRKIAQSGQLKNFGGSEVDIEDYVNSNIVVIDYPAQPEISGVYGSPLDALKMLKAINTATARTLIRRIRGDLKTWTPVELYDEFYEPFFHNLKLEKAHKEDAFYG